MKFLILFLVWCLLLVLCWPLALLALIVFPLVWLLLLPFRLIFLLVEAAFTLIKTILFLPSRLFGHKG